MYRMPAEWAPHDATWLTWPRNKITWPGRRLKEVEAIYVRMIESLLPGEKVHLLVPDAPTQNLVLKRLDSKAKLSNLIFHRVRAVDTWIRDYGPIFVKRVNPICHSRNLLAGIDRSLDPRLKHSGMTNVAFTKWTFNAWGGKYSDLARDNGVVDKLSYLKNFKRIDAPIVLEGGSIDMNGLGTCLTTEQCLLNPNRNPKLSRRQIEKYLERFLGVRKTIWLKEGIEGDDTDGHIDDITRFVGPRKVLTAVESDQTDKNHALLDENLEILKRSTDQDGKRLQIIELPMPGRVGEGGRADSDHERLPASYANFYIGNAAVLLPVYSHPNDAKAVKILKRTFPERKIVPIECTALVYGLGSIHCVTQQQPSS